MGRSETVRVLLGFLRHAGAREPEIWLGIIFVNHFRFLLAEPGTKVFLFFASN